MRLKPIKLCPSKTKTVLLLLGYLAGVAIGIAMGMTPELVGKLLGFLCAALSGIGVIVFILKLIPNSCYLIISEEGITVRALFRQSTIKWENVDEFYVVKIKHRGITTLKMIGLNFSPSYNRHKTARMFSSAIAGAEGGFFAYGMGAEELAVLLNGWLAEMKRTCPT